MALRDSGADPALASFSLCLVRGVFPGCYQPLLPTGPSRGYPCESCLGSHKPYPGGTWSALKVGSRLWTRNKQPERLGVKLHDFWKMRQEIREAVIAGVVVILVL